MASSLLESLGAYVTPDLIARLGSALGESPGSVSKGIGAVLPALLAGVADRSQDPSDFRQLFSLISDPSNDGSALRDPSGLVKALNGGGSLAGLGSRLLTLLFGGRTDAIAQAVAQYAGVSSSSASSLIRLGAPLVLGLLGDRVRREGLGANALAALLGSQRGAIASALPGALASVLGPAAPRTVEPPRVAPRSYEPERRGAPRWLLPLAIGLALLAGLWSVLRGGDEDRVAERAPAITEPAPPPVAAPPPTAAVVRRSLPNGVQITFPNTSLENQVVSFLADSGRSLDTWFNFDRVLFETDSAALKPSSREQLANVAEILKAYPSVQVKVGGYTDNTGNPATNLELSRARANSVRDELVAHGVAANRIEAEGYGQERPVATNDTEAGRAQNRRIAMRVTSR